jgi:hypothetical protein
MSKGMCRFIYNDELWGEIHNRVAKGERVAAAVAYLGRDGAKLLPLKKGDRLVVDMSLGAVRQGVTYPGAVRTLMARGVKVFSRGSLHAKFIVSGRTLIASSANASRKSKETLDEAGILTTDLAAVRRALGFFEKLCTEPVGKEYLAKCTAEYRPPRFKAAAETRLTSPKRGPRVVEAKLWFLGGLVALNLSNEDSASIERLERRAERQQADPSSTEVRWIRYFGKPKFLGNIRLGDWVIDCMKDGDARYVGPPARVLTHSEWTSSRGAKYSVLMLESPTHGEPMVLSQFRTKIRGIQPKLDHVNPRTRPIETNELADKMLRLWTANGKISKLRRPR